MKVAEIPMEKIRTGFAYLKSGRSAARVSAAGIEDPVTVIKADGAFEVVDGFKRLNSLKKTGSSTVPAVIQDWEPVKAKAMMLALNARRSTLSFFEEAALTADLCRKERLTQAAAARLLGRKESWVSKRVAIFTRLDASIIEFLKKGDIGPTIAYHLSRIPSGMQMPLFLSARQENLTVAEVEAAASLVLSVPEVEARKIVRDPRKYFSPPTAPAAEPVPPGISGELASVIRSVTLKGVGLENLKYLSEDLPGSRTRKFIRGERGRGRLPPMGGSANMCSLLASFARSGMIVLL